MAKKKKLPVKLISVIVLVGISGFVVIDFYGCTLNEGVPMDTIDPNDFIYGQATPMFCNISNFLNDTPLGFNAQTELTDLFEIPFDDTIVDVVVEDPNGTVDEIDPEDIIIDENQLDMLNQTDTNDPIIGGNVTEILQPIEDPQPEEITPNLVDIIFVTEVTKVATDGSRETETSEFQFIPLELFVEDTSNKDFSDGRFEIVLKIKTEPNINVEGNGKFDIFLANQTINQSPIPISFSGTTDENGELIIDFISPTGLKSNQFLLNVQPLTSQINSGGITPLEFKILEIKATTFGVDYSVSDETNFKFDFFRDPNQILVMNAEGIQVKGFPTDDQLSIGALEGSVKLSKCYKHTRYSCWMSSAYYQPIGAVTIASIEVRNSNGDLIAQNLTPFTKAYIPDKLLITRNDTYTVKYGKVTSAFGSLPAGSFTFDTPETQKNFRYYCTLTASPTSAVYGSTGLLAGSQKMVCNFP